MPTTSKKPLVIVTRKLPEAVETRMCELFDARLNVDDKPMSQADLAEAVKVAHVLVPTVTDRIDRSLIAQALHPAQADRQFRQRRRQHRPRYRPGAQHHRHQYAGRVRRGHRPSMTMALILAVPRRLAEGTALLKDTRKTWACWSPTWMLGYHRIFGKRRASSAWAASARRWHAAPRPSACRSTTTTACAWRRTSSRSWRRPLGEPRPDARAHGHRLSATAPHARHPSPARARSALKLLEDPPPTSTRRAAR